MVAGFQNIEDNAPPAATPAKASPCPTVLCSRKANAPAFASIAIIGMTAALASSVAQPDLSVFALMYAPPNDPVSDFGQVIFACVRSIAPLPLWGRNGPWPQWSRAKNRNFADMLNDIF